MIDPRDLDGLGDKAALESYISNEFAGDNSAFVTALDELVNNLLRTDLKEATRVVELCQTFRKTIDRRWEARLISLSARLALWSGKYRTALRRYDRALDLFLKFRFYENAARLRKGTIEVHMYLGQYDEALEQGRKALRFFRRKDMAYDAAQTLTNIGNVYHRMDLNREALRYYDKARAIFEKDGGVPLAIVDYNRANIYSNLAQLQRAKKLYAESALVYRENKLHIAEAQANYSVAYLLFLEDRYTEALTLFEHVHETFSNLGDARSAAMSMLDMVEINVRINQFGLAIMLGMQCLPELHRMRMSYEEGKVYYFLAIAHLEMGDNQAAAKNLDHAAKLFRQESNNLWLGIIAMARARLFMGKGSFPAAAKAAQEAHRMFEASQDRRRLSDARLVSLQALFGAGRTEEALNLVRKLRRNQHLAGYQRYRLYQLIADHHFEQQNYDKARRSYQTAIEIVESMLSGLHQDEIRYFFTVDKYQSYARLVECLLRLGRKRDSFVQNLTALSMLNRPAVPDSRLRAEVPDHLLAQIEQLRAQLARMYRFPRSGERRPTATGAYRETEQKLWHLHRKLQAHLYRAGATSFEPKSTPADRLQEIPSGRALVSYHIDDESMGAFVNTADQVDFVRFDTSASELYGNLRRLHFLFENSVSRRDRGPSTTEAVEHYLGVINDSVVAPLLEATDSEHLVIVPSGFLTQIPFIALCDGDGNYLKDQRRVTVSLDPLQSPGDSKRRFDAAVNSVFAFGSEDFRYIEREGRRIKQRFGQARLFAGRKATSTQLAAQLAESDGFIHIAAHASRSSENPLFSRILMADGPYFPFDLFSVGVNARLVTLSGCQTAAPGLYYGNSFSLARAFYQAGGQQVLASLWPVADEVTERFMVTFYSNLKRCGSVTSSYRQAIDKIQEVYVNPALWGPYVLYGED